LNIRFGGVSVKFYSEAKRLQEMIGKRLAALNALVQDFSAADEVPDFDVVAVVVALDDPQKVKSLWFNRDERDYPQDSGLPAEKVAERIELMKQYRF
jgi:hypothetical protein